MVESKNNRKRRVSFSLPVEESHDQDNDNTPSISVSVNGVPQRPKPRKVTPRPSKPISKIHPPPSANTTPTSILRNRDKKKESKSTPDVTTPSNDVNEDSDNSDMSDVDSKETNEETSQVPAEESREEESENDKESSDESDDENDEDDEEEEEEEEEEKEEESDGDNGDNRNNHDKDEIMTDGNDEDDSSESDDDLGENKDHETKLKQKSEFKSDVDDVDAEHSEDTPTPVKTFSELSLDPRVERAIERAGWRKPTSVQGAVIPIAMHGRDVLVSSPTGSGKTAAYVIPVVQHVCRVRSDTSSSPAGTTLAVVFVPTRELVHQVTNVFKNLCRFIDGVHVSSVSMNKDGGIRTSLKRPLNKNNDNKTEDQTDKTKTKSTNTMYRSADILVGTPASVNALQKESDSNNPLNSIQFVVVDEADLVLSYGYEKDAREALAAIPTSAQSMLLSATLDTEGMDSFRKIILRRPMTVKVSSDDDPNEDGSVVGATHYLARLQRSKDRYLVTYAMLRLNVLCGKVLIFVNHIGAAFRLKLFLDQFKVKSVVLNSELPANSRIHCVQQFNAGVFDILIAADESNLNSGKSKSKNTKGKTGPRKRSRIEKDEEFGLSRGVDFQNVAAVLNFDSAVSLHSYTHRAGRTARGGKSGTVLSLACSDENEQAVRDIAKEAGVHVGPLAFRMEQIEAFRYRVESCLRLVTDSAVHGARLADVRKEMLNSEQLKGHFEENPDDLDALQHNMRLAKNVSEHLGHIPAYLLPVGMRDEVGNAMTTAGGRWKGGKSRKKHKTGNNNSRKADPLKGFSTSGNSKERFWRKKDGIKKKRGGALKRSASSSKT